MRGGLGLAGGHSETPINKDCSYVLIGVVKKSAGPRVGLDIDTILTKMLQEVIDSE